MCTAPNPPLHRGFSLFLFNRRGEVLLQQRSHRKKTWPLVWSNSCCGHPELGESNAVAARRRLGEELGMSAGSIEEISPYRYECSRDGVMENEICSILVGFSEDEPRLNPDEVEAVAWMPWQDFLREMKTRPDHYSFWCIEEAAILEAHPRFRERMERSLSGRDE